MLSEQRRQQLDGIIQQMVRNKEKDSDIQFVVDDFKSKYENETQPQGKSGIAGFALGAGKGILSTLKGAATLGEKIIGAPTRGLQRLAGQEVTQPTSAETVFPKALVEPVGKAEKAGFVTEQIGEFFIPTPIGKIKNPNILKRALLEAVDVGSKTAVQTGGDIEETAKAGAFGVGGGVFGGVVSKGLQKTLPNLSKTLEKINLRLTPAQKRNLGGKIDSAVEYIEKNKITGTPVQRLDKANDLYEKTEDTLQAFLKENKNIKVNKNDIIENIEVLKGKYANERDVLAIEKQLDSFIDLLQKKQPDQISIETLNKLKRSTYKNAYNKAGDKVLDYVEHDIGDVLRVFIEDSTQGLTLNGKAIGEFNREYGNLILARKLLKAAESRKQVGLIGKLIALGVGGSIGTALGGPIGAAVGAAASAPIAEGLAGTAARSLTSQVLKRLANLPADKAQEELIKILLPIIRESQRGENLEAPQPPLQQ